MNALNDLLASPLTLRIGWTLLHFLWQGAAVAMLLAMLLRFLRRRSANTRYTAAGSTMLTMAIAPLLTFALLPAATSAPTPRDSTDPFDTVVTTELSNGSPLPQRADLSPADPYP